MNSLKELWTHIKGEVKETSGMADASYNLWIKDLELSRLTESCAYILAPYDYQLNILSNKYKPIIEECICNCIGFEVEAVIISIQKPERPIDDIIDDHIAYGGGQADQQQNDQRPHKEGAGMSLCSHRWKRLLVW